MIDAGPAELPVVLRTVALAIHSRGNPGGTSPVCYEAALKQRTVLSCGISATVASAYILYRSGWG
jgi:hypothetical protein